MGNQNKLPIHLQLKHLAEDWEEFDTSHYYNKITNQLITKQFIQIPTNQLQLQVNFYNQRMQDHNTHTIKLVYYHPHSIPCDYCASCLHSSFPNCNTNWDIYTESVTLFQLNHQCVCISIINGFANISRNYGNCRVNHNMIFKTKNIPNIKTNHNTNHNNNSNHNDSIRVWLNESPSNNEYVSSSQSQMIKDIMNILTSPKYGCRLTANCSTIPIDFKTLLQKVSEAHSPSEANKKRDLSNVKQNNKNLSLKDHSIQMKEGSSYSSVNKNVHHHCKSNLKLRQPLGQVYLNNTYQHFSTQNKKLLTFIKVAKQFKKANQQQDYKKKISQFSILPNNITQTFPHKVSPLALRKGINRHSHHYQYPRQLSQNQGSQQRQRKNPTIFIGHKSSTPCFHLTPNKLPIDNSLNGTIINPPRKRHQSYDKKKQQRNINTKFIEQNQPNDDNKGKQVNGQNKVGYDVKYVQTSNKKNIRRIMNKSEKSLVCDKQLIQCNPEGITPKQSRFHSTYFQQYLSQIDNEEGENNQTASLNYDIQLDRVIRSTNQMYTNQENQIRRKINHKKRQFAHLKAEANKLLQ